MAAAQRRLELLALRGLGVYAELMKPEAVKKAPNVAAQVAKDSIDRVHGKAVQRTELSGADAGPIVISWGEGE
jgi:hypothetical protein